MDAKRPGLPKRGRPAVAKQPCATGVQEVQAVAGIDRPRTLRDLRHTYATLHLGLGSHVRIAQDLLGHARTDMALDTYTSSVPAATREAVSRLGELFARARSESGATS